jgi:hypothetical protein
VYSTWHPCENDSLSAVLPEGSKFLWKIVTWMPVAQLHLSGGIEYTQEQLQDDAGYLLQTFARRWPHYYAKSHCVIHLKYLKLTIGVQKLLFFSRGSLLQYALSSHTTCNPYQSREIAPFF